MNKYSFQKGMGQVRMKDIHEVKAKLMTALNIHTPQGLGYRIRGVYALKAEEKGLIEAVFAEYGITDIWGS